MSYEPLLEDVSTATILKLPKGFFVSRTTDSEAQNAQIRRNLVMLSNREQLNQPLINKTVVSKELASTASSTFGRTFEGLFIKQIVGLARTTFVSAVADIRIRRLKRFLDALAKNAMISSNTASLALQAWQELSSTLSYSLLIPEVGIEPDDKLLYSWNVEQHHFELEIFPNGTGEFFYINHDTDEMWSDEYIIGKPIPNAVKNGLAPFLLYDT